MASPYTMVSVAGHDVRVSNPDKVFFSARGETKLDLVQYYLAVGAGALRAVHLRPTVLKRFPEGAEGKLFFQKRVPAEAPRLAADGDGGLPERPDRRGALPDRRRPPDLGGQPGLHRLQPVGGAPLATSIIPTSCGSTSTLSRASTFDEVRQVAGCVRDVLDDHGLVGYPKTSGSRGIHVNVRVDGEVGLPRAFAGPRWRSPARSSGAGPTSPRRSGGRRSAAGACSSTTTRTRATAPSRRAYSVRANPEARVSCPFRWAELDDVELGDFTLATVPARYEQIGDLEDTIDDVSYSLTSLLELAARDEAEGLGDAPWPPNFAKQAGEPPRVQPSRARQAHGTAS